MAAHKLQGEGQLEVDRAPLVAARYDIAVMEVGHRHDGQGRLYSDEQALFNALRAGEATLILENGLKVAIVLTNHIAKSREAEFVTYGPVPIPNV